MPYPMDYPKVLNILDNYVERTRLGQVSEPLNYKNEEDVNLALNYLKRTDMERVTRNFKGRIRKAYRMYLKPESYIKANLTEFVQDLSQPHIDKGELDEGLLVDDVINITNNHFQQHMLYRRAAQNIEASLNSKGNEK